MSGEGLAFVGLIALPLLVAAGGIWLTAQAAILAGKGVIWTAKKGVHCGRKLSEEVDRWVEEREKSRKSELANERRAEWEEQQQRQRQARASQEEQARVRRAAWEAERQRLAEAQRIEREGAEAARRVRADQQRAWEQEAARLREERASG